MPAMRPFALTLTATAWGIALLFAPGAQAQSLRELYDAGAQLATDVAAKIIARELRPADHDPEQTAAVVISSPENCRSNPRAGVRRRRRSGGPHRQAALGAIEARSTA